MTKRSHEDMSYPEMSLFMNESMSDVVFVIDGQRLPALKQTLSLKSLVFRAMFSGNFIESKQSEESKLPEIEIKDTTFDAFQTLIRFIYTEQMALKNRYNFEDICDVYRLSDRYEVLRLRQRVAKYFESRINVKDLNSISRIVFTQNIEELMAIVMTFIAKNINELIEWDIKDLKELNESINDKLLDVLTSDHLKYNTGLTYCYIGGGGLHLKNQVLLAKKFIRKLDSIDNITTNDAFKTFIGYLYFDKLILKDEDDFQLIRELCRLSTIYIPSYNPFEECVGNHLKERITVENLESISGIAFDYGLDALKKRVNSFTKRNFAKIVTKNEDILVKINNSTDDSLLKALAEFTQKIIRK